MKKSIVFLSILLLSFFAWSRQSIRPWIGISIEEHEKGVFVKESFKDTPGFRAGFKNGDIITEIDGQKVKNPNDLVTTLAQKGVGSEVVITFLSDGKEKKVTIKLEAMPSMTEMAEKNLLGNPAPDFTAKILSGSEDKEYSLGKSKGRVKIVEFWATWCGVCIKVLPAMAALAKDQKNIDVIFISNEKSAVVKKYIKTAKERKAANQEIIFLQSDGDSIQRDYFVPGYPMFFLIDKQNKVRDLTVGIGKDLVKMVNKAQRLSKDSGVKKNDLKGLVPSKM